MALLRCSCETVFVDCNDEYARGEYEGEHVWFLKWKLSQTTVEHAKAHQKQWIAEIKSLRWSGITQKRDITVSNIARGPSFRNKP